MKQGVCVLRLTKGLRNCIWNVHLQRPMSSASEITKDRKPDVGTARILKLVREKQIPVESYSLCRGLALNRFEKDFLVFPEYTDPDELINIKSFVSVFKKDFESSMIDADRKNFSTKCQNLLMRHQLNAACIPKSFDGLEMSRKDLLAVYEILGLNWNVYETVSQLHLAATLIILFGSNEQKARLLPKIASGELRPAVCIFEEKLNDYGQKNLMYEVAVTENWFQEELEKGHDFLNMKTVVASGGEKAFKIDGVKTEVIGASTANLFFVFGVQMTPRTVDDRQKRLVCYLLELGKENEGSVEISPRTKTLGLDALEVSKVEFRNVSVDETSRLGSVDVGADIVGEVMAAKNINYAAAVTGFMRSLIGKLANYCNTTVEHNVTLADDKGIQKLMTDVALNTFVLESMAYYIGGLLDENLIIAVDIENAVINNFANRVLREGVTAMIEILGLGSCDCDFEYEKMIRDSMTVISMGNRRRNLTDLVAMNTITSWASANALNLEKLRSGAAGFFGFISGKGAEWRFQEKPKLKHFIAEHAHPSLQEACQNLEYTMSHLNALIGAVLRRHGKNIVNDFPTLSSIAKVIEYNLGMIATISRSSRSYSIGLRNSDIEVAWTTSYCAFANQKAAVELQVLDKFFGLVQMNPSLLNVGRSVFESKGYCVESPVELNW